VFLGVDEYKGGKGVSCMFSSGTGWGFVAVLSATESTEAEVGVNRTCGGSQSSFNRS
jgi:hypothetical protein